MIIETLALFTCECPDAQDEINVLTGDVITNSEGTMLYPTPFAFDFMQVIAVNPSQYQGWSAVRFYADAFTIKMDYRDAFELFKKCRKSILVPGVNNA